MFTTEKFELVGKKEFVVVTLDLDDEIFIVYIASIISLHPIHPSHLAQIALLKADEMLIAILFKFADFVEVFSLDLVAKLPKPTRINNHDIKLIESR